VTTGRRDAGQAVVEVALALPLVCTLVVGILQIALVGRNRLALEVAAREAARAAAVSADPRSAALAAAHAAVTLRPLVVDVATGTTAGVPSVTATIGWTDPTEVPIVGVFIPDIPLGAEVTMTIEPP